MPCLCRKTWDSRRRMSHLYFLAPTLTAGSPRSCSFQGGDATSTTTHHHLTSYPHTPFITGACRMPSPGLLRACAAPRLRCAARTGCRAASRTDAGRRGWAFWLERAWATVGLAGTCGVYAIPPCPPTDADARAGRLPPQPQQKLHTHYWPPPSHPFAHREGYRGTDTPQARPHAHGREAPVCAKHCSRMTRFYILSDIFHKGGRIFLRS